MTEITNVAVLRRAFRFFSSRISFNTETTDFTNWTAGGGLVALTLFLAGGLPPWIAMWTLALSLFFAAKGMTLHRALALEPPASPGRLAAYLLLWPGMDARSFCAKHPVTVPKPDELIFAAIKTVGGGLLLWVGVRRIGTHHPLLTGWAGMAALVMMVHFGIFHLLSLFWRARGVAARPIMQSPFTATTLSRLWSRGWNTAFTDLMHTCLLKPAARGVGPAGAVSLVFVVSGLLHELVISVPARGGYGLPTAYFLTQGLGLLLERSKFGCKLGLGSGLRGWCFAALVAGGPAFWLFPPPFIYNVILPMLRAFGVIGGNL